MRPRRGLLGGGIGTIVLVLAALYFGIDPTFLIEGMQSANVPASTAGSQPSAQDLENDPLADMIAVVIPCYRVKGQILDVLSGIGPECRMIYVVDDGCPEGTGDHVETECNDPRVRVVRHERNQGVGGAIVVAQAFL